MGKGSAKATREDVVIFWGVLVIGASIGCEGCLSGFWCTSFISAVEAFRVDCVHLLYPVAFSYLQRVRWSFPR